jgi:outer membrane biosynthesis protein TonB
MYVLKLGCFLFLRFDWFLVFLAYVSDAHSTYIPSDESTDEHEAKALSDNENEETKDESSNEAEEEPPNQEQPPNEDEPMTVAERQAWHGDCVDLGMR